MAFRWIGFVVAFFQILLQTIDQCQPSKVSNTAVNGLQKTTHLFVWINGNAATLAHLRGIGPRITRHPVSIAPAAFIFAEASIRALVGRFSCFHRQTPGVTLDKFVLNNYVCGQSAVRL